MTQPGREAGSPWALYPIFFASGCAGLVYEVMWTRSFGLVFGSTTRAAAVVLGAFFLGMALGNWLGARLSGGTTRGGALRSYAWLELGVAATSLLVLGWLALYHGVYPRLYRATQESPAALAALQLVLAALALGPPCVAMGATLPLMSRAVVASEAHLGRRLGFVYAVNTLGGVSGVLLAGFWLPVLLGVRGSTFLAALLNVLAALAAFRAARGLESAASPEVAPREVAQPSLRGPALVLAVVATASGLGTLALEVVFTRLLVNAMDSSVFSFALVLATFLVSLALGAALVSALVDRVASPWTLIAAGSWLGAAAILVAPLLLTRVWLGSLELPFWTGPLGTASLLLPITALVIGPPALAIGSVLPATWRAAIARADDAGAFVGRLTSLNTLAGVAGSLAAGFLLIPRLGVASSLLPLACLYAALGVLALLQGEPAVSRRAVALVAVAAFVALASSESWRILPSILEPGDRLVAVDEGEGATVTVTEGAYGRQLVMNSRYTLGSSHGVYLHRSQGELALVLQGEPRSVAFIGVATGMSLSSIHSYPGIERVVAMELVPGVLRMAEFFREQNGGVLEDPRVEIRLADGRNHLFGTDERFDAIVGDLFVPWHAGTGYLYTREHFATVRERLRERGVFVQWLQVDQASKDVVASLAGSFTAAFDEAELWLNERSRGQSLLGFVGFRGRGPTTLGAHVNGIRRICSREVLRDWARAAPLNTDDFPYIEFSAAASRYRRRSRQVREVMDAVAWLQAEDERRWLVRPSP